MNEEDDFREIDVVDELETTLLPKRTRFLSILCILTWIWSGVSLILLVYSFISGKQTTAVMMKNAANAWFLVGLASPVVCSIGSILMWHLNKIGFLIYLAGQLALVMLSFYVAILLEKVHGPSLVFTVIGSVVPVGFIVLYALNLSGMKKWRSPSDPAN